MMRLDKFLVSQGIGSRSEVQRTIRSGQVLHNGTVCKKPEQKTDELHDKITYCGEFIEYRKFVYVMLNKPAGVLSATEDKNAKTAVDLLPADLQRRGVFVAGRLDKDTEGLLLLTDDGDFAHKVMSPKKGVFKKYYAKLSGSVTAELAQNFRNGLTLADGTQLKPAFIEVLAGDTSAIVKICEGKFHQVKRMFETGGLKVLYLKRLSIGGLALDEDLPLGKARLLSDEECEKIFVQSA